MPGPPRHPLPDALADALRRLEASEQRYRDLVAMATDWTWEMDERLRFSYLSPHFPDVAGTDPADVIGRTRAELAVGGVTPEAWREHLETLAAHRAFRDFAYTVTAADGRRVHLTVSGHPVLDDAGRFRGYRGTGRDVTRVVEAEREARAAHLQLLDAVESLAGGVSLYDADDRLVLFNSKGAELYGDDPGVVVPGARFEDVMRDRLRRGVILDALGREEAWLSERLATRRAVGDPFELHMSSGRTLLVVERLTEAGHRVGVSTDVTELKRTENLMRRLAEGTASATGEEFFRAFVRSLAGAMGARWAYVAEALDESMTRARTLAFVADGELASPFEYALEGSPCADTRAHGVCLIESGVQARYPHDAGLVRLGAESYVGTLLRSSAGAPIGIVAVVDDAPAADDARAREVLRIFASRAAAEIERKRADAELAASRALLRTVIDAIPSRIAVRDRDLRMILVNRARAELAGLTEAAYVTRGEDYPSLLPGQVESVRARDRSVLETGIAAEGEATRYRRWGGSERVRYRVVPLRDEHGAVIGTVNVSDDVTEQRRLEAALRQAQKMEAVGKLTGGIAHDFNNILASVLGFSRLAQARAGALGDERLDRYLAEIARAGERASDLVAQLLAFSRREAGARRAVDLAASVAETLALARPSIPGAIEVVEDSGRAGEVIVDADPVQLHRAAMNLCVNARDAVEGTGRIEVAVARVDVADATCASCGDRYAGAFAELAVRDTGPGIEPDVLARMFDPFFTTKGVGSGTGLGLSVVHGIVHEHGGHLVAGAAEGGGASFRLHLPLAAPADAAPPAPARAARRGDGARVLAVDDEPALARYVEELLAGDGYRVSAFTDANAALAAFEAAPESFDVVVADQVMPGLSGIDLARRVHARRADLPVILCTGYVDRLDDTARHAYGVEACLTKPVDAARLLELVRTVCG